MSSASSAMVISVGLPRLTGLVHESREVVECLDDEARNDAPILRMHVWPISIEDARNPNGESVLALIIVE
jgi:hypothetical protein